MKNKKIVVDKRRDKIYRLIKEAGDLRVDELSEVLEVPPLTIRRDLQVLESKKLIERYYGGARIFGQSLAEYITDYDHLKRQKIGKEAAKLVEDNDTIFINTSSTALSILPYINAKHVTVVTNNGNAIYTPHSSQVTILLVGGELSHVKGTMLGDFALDNIMKVSADKCFLGCSGFNISSGVFTSILAEVILNQAFVSKTLGDVVLMASKEKFGKNAPFSSVNIADIDLIVTDDLLKDEDQEALDKLGIGVINSKE